MGCNDTSKIGNYTSAGTTQILSIIVQPIIGAAIILINILLIIFFKQKSQRKEITFLFLTNLAISDMQFGAGLITRALFLVAIPQYFTDYCRFLFSFGAILPVMMSAYCIFLISLQVSF